MACYRVRHGASAFAEAVSPSGDRELRLITKRHVLGQMILCKGCCLFDGRPDRPSGKTEARHNSLIFIGRNLDRGKLEGGFKACLA